MKVTRLIIFIMLGSLLFYWFQWRPTKIRHECSWVRKYSDAIPAKQGLTEEQLRDKGMLRTCPAFNGGLEAYLPRNHEKNECYFSNEDIIEQHKPQNYVPAKEWWIKASKEEYEFCLHDQGLK